MLHIWIVIERLRYIAYEIAQDINQYNFWQRLTNFDIKHHVSNGHRVLKMISYLNQRFMKIFEKQTEKSLSLIKIHPTQMKKIKSICDKQAAQVSSLLYNHFDIENKGYTDIDILMNSIFYPRNQSSHNFPDFVFKIAEYTMKQREYLSHLTLEDIKVSNIEWDAFRVDPEVVKVMKKIRKDKKSADSSSIQNNLDLEDLAIIETLEKILPDETPSKPPKQSKAIPDQKYKPQKPPKV